MGKKQNVYLLRTAINGWNKSIWMAKNKSDYSKNLLEDYKIREYICSIGGHDKISETVIQRINDRVIVTIYVNKAYHFVKSKDEKVKPLQEQIQAYVNKNFSGIIDVRIEEVNNVDADAKLIAGNIAAQITNRQNYKRAAKRAVRMAMKAGALGIRIRLSGRLGGVSIARTVQYTEGTVPLQTFKVKIDQASVQAPTSYGICGVKVLVTRN